LYNNSESFFSKNDPTHSLLQTDDPPQSLSYVSDQDKDAGSTEPLNDCNSTGSSSSGHASPHERKEKEFLEETVRQQNKVIQKLRKKIQQLEDHIRGLEYERQIEDNYFTHTPSQSFPHSPSNMTQPEAITHTDGKEQEPVFEWKMQNSFERFHDYGTRPRQRSEPTLKTYPTHQRSASYSYSFFR